MFGGKKKRSMYMKSENAKWKFNQVQLRHDIKFDYKESLRVVELGWVRLS